jgi:GDP-L-fucose synthase
VPALIRKMLAGADEVVLWGDGSPTREFLYVEDAAEAFLLAADRQTGAEPINIGTGEEISIGELAETIAELTGFGGEIVWDRSMPNGQPRRRLDTNRALELLGFRAATPLREGLGRTIEWYREASPLPSGR